MTAPMLEADALRVTFPAAGGTLHAVDTVSLRLERGETLGIVGESGSGKSTLALTLMRAHRPEAGRVLLDGTDITALSPRALRPHRRKVGMVFQDPYGSLDPRWTVGRIVAEPLAVHHRLPFREAEAAAAALLARVGLPPDAARRMPAQFSGGQRQRIAIARALALEPPLLVADEPVSALDVSIQAQVVNLLRDLRERAGLAMLVIAHDLAVVHQLSSRIAVMYLGEIVEEGSADDVALRPLHPYTVALLSARPALGEAPGRRIVLRGDAPSPIHRPDGCRFHPRCPIARPRCATEKPPLRADAARRVACWYAGELVHLP